MDIVESEFMKNRYPDQQEKELIEVSKCYACSEVLYENDEVINWDGILCCDLKKCLMKTVGATEIILGKVED